MDIGKLREQIPTTQRMTYLNTGWAGPSTVSVVEAVSRRLQYESYNGPTSVEVLDSGEAIDLEAREAVAGLIGASADEVLLTSSTTDGINTVMTGLPWEEGDEIVTCNLEHSSILLPSYQLQRLCGVKVNVLTVDPGEAHESILSKVEDAITDRTRMVFFSHIEYSTGLRIPVEGIRKLTAGRGIWMLIDGAQGAGHVSVDVGEIDCDFYAMPGQKWLLGPDGTGRAVHTQVDDTARRACAGLGQVGHVVRPLRRGGARHEQHRQVHGGHVERPPTRRVRRGHPVRERGGHRGRRGAGDGPWRYAQGAAGRHATRGGAVADERAGAIGPDDVQGRREGPGADRAPAMGHASHSDTRRQVSVVPAGIARLLQYRSRGRTAGQRRR